MNPLYPRTAGTGPTIRVLTQAELLGQNQAVSKPGQGRCQSEASARVFCTTSKLRAIMKGLVAETLPVITEETTKQTSM